MLKCSSKSFIYLALAIFTSFFPIASHGAELLGGNPLKDLFVLKQGRSMRASSSDPAWQTGNNDWRPFGSNTSITIADLKGPGVITHIWMTIADSDMSYSRLMAIRIYWDGETKPSVEAPIGDFFAVGHGIDATVDSLPVQVSSNGRGRNCFWPMPFKKSAKIVITNENPSSGGGILYWYVDWVKADSLPKDTAYFHAQYRQEYPAKQGRYLLMQAKGSGHYIGTVYSVLANMPGWIGEGDDFFYIDGEKEPSLRGTGTEDYFADGWGFRLFNQPYHGVTLWEGEITGGHTTAYRWHIDDPIIFTKSLKAEIEHVGPVFDRNDKMTSGYGERADNISSVAFWYQKGGGPNWTTMPAGPDRLPPHFYIEAEKSYFTGSNKLSDEFKSVDGAQWSGGAYLLFTPSSKARKAEFHFTVKGSGRYDVSADFILGPEMGNYLAKLDGRVLGIFATLNNSTTHKWPYSWGIKELQAGDHKLVFEYQGPSGAGTSFGMDGIDLRPIGIVGD